MVAGWLTNRDPWLGGCLVLPTTRLTVQLELVQAGGLLVLVRRCGLDFRLKVAPVVVVLLLTQVTAAALLDVRCLCHSIVAVVMRSVFRMSVGGLIATTGVGWWRCRWLREDSGHSGRRVRLLIWTVVAEMDRRLLLSDSLIGFGITHRFFAGRLRFFFVSALR